MARPMFDFAPASGLPKPELYRQLGDAAAALVEGETDAIANMANVAALLAEFLPDLNWSGFYRAARTGTGGKPAEELVLGPFIGRPACIRIPFGQGVCGAAAATGRTQLVPDVHAFPGHIACDAHTRSELVVPIILHGRVSAVLDLDSPLEARFDEEDARGIEALVARIGPSLATSANAP